ncbi:hypothetical protein CBX60_02760 [Salmonella enterica subsp. enterica serovar Pensacola]|nr:hypothetical protein [Salmonella enterica subsp. enterica serovar Poona]EBH1514793.1 hypothetical protein [Salmonella enterica]ECT8863579.1 hypothetical protein [Salmonella enterica subsp. enterica serovar Pensacola]EBU7356301.1 hypothetical protein [Salmonella enterica subsp. enterica serovar Poona]ECA2556999.1 hypothetical protein [Salmonella enterica subsp. enterica serovar Poona]
MNILNRTYNTIKWFNIDKVIVNHRP